VVAANLFSFLPSSSGSGAATRRHDVFGAAHKTYLRYQETLWASALARKAAGKLTGTCCAVASLASRASSIITPRTPTPRT
jgi:hypothetical protein